MRKLLLSYVTKNQGLIQELLAFICYAKGIFIRLGNGQHERRLRKDSGNQLIAQQVVILSPAASFFPVCTMHIKALFPAEMVLAIVRNNIDTIAGHAIERTVLCHIIKMKNPADRYAICQQDFSLKLRKYYPSVNQSSFSISAAMSAGA